MRFSQYLSFLHLVLISLLAACSRQAPLPLNPRVAIAEFDNQGTAADRWVRPLLGYVIVYQLNAEKQLAPGLVNDAEGWRTLGVGRVISGHYRREASGIRIHAQLTDAATTSILEQFDEVVEEAKLLEASTRLVSKLLRVKPAGLTYELSVWRGFAETQVGAGAAPLAAFVGSNPDFAPAYPILADSLVRSGKRDEALALLQKFPVSADPLTLAQMDYTLAADAGAKIRALEKLIELRQGEPRILAELAGIASSQGNWDLTARTFRELSRLEPLKVEWWNGLAYAEANQLHLPAAVAALNEYRKIAPNEPNVIDSLGEVHYLNRKFTEAAKYFDEQWQRYPAFQNGSGLRKAAFSHYFAGDLKTADLRFGEWQKQVLGNLPASGQVFQQAIWLARTGRAPQARSLLAKEQAESSGDRKVIAGYHLAMLEFGLEGKAPPLSSIQTWGREIKDPQARNEFSVFALMAQPAPNAGALKARITAAIPQPQLAQLRNELMAAADLLYSPVKPEKPKLFPLPNSIDTSIDVLLLRSRLAVIP